jgi:hypothetical protein
MHKFLCTNHVLEYTLRKRHGLQGERAKTAPMSISSDISQVEYPPSEVATVFRQDQAIWWNCTVVRAPDD